jgi:hypothetical protein
MGMLLDIFHTSIGYFLVLLRVTYITRLKVKPPSHPPLGGRQEVFGVGLSIENHFDFIGLAANILLPQRGGWEEAFLRRYGHPIDIPGNR